MLRRSETLADLTYIFVSAMVDERHPLLCVKSPTSELVIGQKVKNFVPDKELTITVYLAYLFDDDVPDITTTGGAARGKLVSLQQHIADFRLSLKSAPTFVQQLSMLHFTCHSANCHNTTCKCQNRVKLKMLSAT